MAESWVTDPFFEPTEAEIAERFLREGYVVVPVSDRRLVDRIRGLLYEKGASLLASPTTPTISEFFDKTHEYVLPENLNSFRVALIGHMNQDQRLRSDIYGMVKQYIDWIVGNELAMQRACNLGIQLPGDDSSLLPLHSDVWSGNSPYEVVCWLPLVDSYRTKSMFLVPRQQSQQIYDHFSEYANLNSEEFYRAIKEHAQWMEVPYGSAMIFSHSLLHGNRVNEEADTRWTINSRFKSLLSPYETKELGESFLPITVRPATRIGFQYKKPSLQ